MSKEKITIKYTRFDSDAGLTEEDRSLLSKARAFTKNAFAPYSNFKVAAVGKTLNGRIFTGTNQENASFPAGLCAERVMLSAFSLVANEDKLETVAISFKRNRRKSDVPVSPCGICRQSLVEYEERGGAPIRLILSGQEGEVLVIDSAKDLLPFSFGKNDLD